MADFIEVSVDATDLLRFTDQRLPAYIDGALYIAAIDLQPILQDLVKDVFRGATAGLSSDSWPLEYTNHLMLVIDTLPIQIYRSGTGLDVSIDLDELGTQEDLELAYHFGAILKSGGKVTLPFTGTEGDLKYSVERRYRFLVLNIMPSYAWDLTIDARIRQWARKAPEWLFLQYGTEWDPVIYPSPIVEEIEVKATRIVENLVFNYINAAIDQEGRIGELSFEPRGVGSRIRGPRGRFVAEKPYGST